MAKKAGRRKTGRPSDFDEQIAAKICQHIATHADGIRAICRRKSFPDTATVYRWITIHEAFRSQYARERELQCQLLADQIIEIADKVQLGTITKTNSLGKKEKRTGDMVQRAALQIDARKWVLSKLVPKKYGDALTGDEGKNPVTDMISAMHKLYEQRMQSQLGEQPDETPLLTEGEEVA